jgi:hypothetical protein
VILELAVATYLVCPKGTHFTPHGTTWAGTSHCRDVYVGATGPLSADGGACYNCAGCPPPNCNPESLKDGKQ